MSELTKIFDNKRDQQDFWIAIAVILLFLLGFLWYLGGKNLDVSNALPTSDLENEPEIVEVIVVDTDGDGIADENDKCPELAGIAINNGCPADTDGDGIYDSSDLCPEYAGDVANNGCPPDSDKDGIHNGIDKCPKKAGPADNNGCPIDSDGDGVADANDKCPMLAGKPSNNGCPDVKIAEEDASAIEIAARSVEFETGKSVLKNTSLKNLDQIAEIMAKYRKYKLRVEGHTDNTSNPEANQVLSEQRAKACYDYLISKDIKSRRLISKGYGESKPIADNETPQGRQQNRRVEFHFTY